MIALPAIGVCGFGRCGSTMLMTMLDAGGIPPVDGSAAGSYELPRSRDRTHPMTATTSDVALVAQAIDDELPLIGITASWSAAQAVIVALDKAQRLAPTPGVQRCGECDREILLGRYCQSCRRAEDGPYEERCDVA